MDFSCILAALLMFTGNLLLVIWGGIEKSRPTFDWKSYSSLDPSFLEEHWIDRTDLSGLHLAGGFIVAIAWIFLAIPICQLAWIMSDGGRRLIWLHAMICTMVFAGSSAEFGSRLMHIGSTNAAVWISREFSLDHWSTISDTNPADPNGVGWKSLEVSYQLVQGMILWIDGFEYFALFAVLTLNYFSIRFSQIGLMSYEMCFAGMGFFIGTLSLADFIFLILRFTNWDTFNLVSIIMTILIRVVLLPLWLLVLGCKLPAAVHEFSQRRTQEGTNILPPKIESPTSSPSAPAPDAFTIGD